MKKMNKKGFTIVELVIVIAVIAILAAVMIPTFSTIIDKANQSKALQEVKAAYSEQLAEDLSVDGGVDVVYNQALAVKHANGTVITIGTKGEIAIAAAGTEYNYELVDGEFVAYEAPCQHVDEEIAEGADAVDGKCDLCGADMPQ